MTGRTEGLTGDPTADPTGDRMDDLISGQATGRMQGLMAEGLTADRMDGRTIGLVATLAADLTDDLIAYRNTMTVNAKRGAGLTMTAAERIDNKKKGAMHGSLLHLSIQLRLLTAPDGAEQG